MDARWMLACACGLSMAQLGCSGAPDDACRRGEERPCTCADGSEGSQTCQEDEAGWSPCECLGGDGDADADGDSDGDDDGLDPDLDSDGDCISDVLEGRAEGVDTDGDGTEDYLDTDSDGDGMEDRVEAQNPGCDPSAAPVDSDGDGEPDYRDEDSDDDGMTDAWEWENRESFGTDPRDPDTDDDGLLDWIEYALGTDPLDGTDLSGWLVFVAPYDEEPTPAVVTAELRTALAAVDLFLVSDLTGSMTMEIIALGSDLPDVAADISCEPGEDPGATGCVPDLWVGFGWFSEALTGGSYAALEVTSNLTADVAAVADSMPTMSTLGARECARRAAYCTVHGPGDPYCPPAMTRNLDVYPCPGDGIGFPCFRPDALRLLVLMTDEGLDEDPEPSFEEIAAELLSVHLTFVGINTEPGRDATVTADLAAIALPTGSVDQEGEPLVFMGADDAVSAAVTSAVSTVAQLPRDVTARVVATPSGGVDPLVFIDHIAIDDEADARCAPPWPDRRDEDGDGLDDTYEMLAHGHLGCWSLHAAANRTVEEAALPQTFTATIEARGGPGGALLDAQDVYILIPPETFVAPDSW